MQVVAVEVVVKGERSKVGYFGTICNWPELCPKAYLVSTFSVSELGEMRVKITKNEAS